MKKIKLYYLISSIVSIFFICISIVNINNTIEEYKILNNKGDDKEVIICLPFFIWKFSLFLNSFIFFAVVGFIGYLILKRKTNYSKKIFIRIGPTIDTIIIIFLTIMSILFGPFLSSENIMILIYYKEILYSCKFSEDDMTKTIYVPYIILGFLISFGMNLLLFFLFSRRCSRRRLFSRNSLNIGQIVDII